jgi:two-component sensor histidine kinase
MTGVLPSVGLLNKERPITSEDYAHALINILEDVAEERTRFKEAQTALLNILDDYAIEQRYLQQVQKAMLNILDDLQAEKGHLELARNELQRSEWVRSSLREKEVLLREVHHRVKNNLQVISSLINTQARALPDVASRDALKECRNRVLAIALIHEQLYRSTNYARVSFREYVRDLATNIFHALNVSPLNVTLDVAMGDFPLAVDKAIPCGLILNELVSNALKHAFPNERKGTVRVEFRRASDRQLVVTVSDNGIGMPGDFDPATSNSIGLQIVSTLAKQLHGQVDIAIERGTTFQVSFPMEAPS